MDFFSFSVTEDRWKVVIMAPEVPRLGSCHPNSYTNSCDPMFLIIISNSLHSAENQAWEPNSLYIEHGTVKKSSYHCVL